MIAADDPVALAESARGWRSAYVHIPFCRRVCPYCDFAVVAGRNDLADRYVDALIVEMRADEPLGRLDAVFVGGGTPSQLRPDLLGRIIDALDDVHGLRSDAEITMEANPEDWDDAYGRGVIEVGINRVSLGVQSLDGSVLTSLGRLHTPERALEAVTIATESQLRSVNVDLIFGTVGETLSSWESTVERVLASNVDHVSAYALTVERGTPLSVAVAGGAPAPDEDDQADKWEFVNSASSDSGLTRYEVSNFSRPGHYCRYNLSTWGQGNYAGYGLGAHGHRNGTRTRNVRKLDAYLGVVESGGSPEQGRDTLDAWDRELERVMLGLRRSVGVIAGEAGRRLLASEEGTRLTRAGILGHADGRLFAADPLRTDSIIRAVLDLSET